jgi:hypothetical protein
MLFAATMLLACAGSEALKTKEIQQQAAKVYQADQTLRQQLHQAFLQRPRNEQKLQQLMKQQNALDAQHQIWAGKVLDQYGWPSPPMFTEGGVSQALFVVLQHAGLEFQQAYFPLVESAAKQGLLGLDALAYLTDRIRVQQGKPQWYGTQLSAEGSGAAVFYPIAQPQTVNQRRQQMGLPSLQSYAQKLGIALPDALFDQGANDVHQ